MTSPDNLIYGILDPRTNVCVYVGQTTEGIKRPITHLVNSHNYMLRRFVSELLKDNLVPHIHIFESNLSINQLDEKESYWVKSMSDKNPNLFNIMLNRKEDFFNDFDRDHILFLRYLISDVTNIVKSIRIKYGLSQQDVADLCGVNRSTIVISETKNMITLGLLRKILSIEKKCVPADRAPDGWDCFFQVNEPEYIPFDNKRRVPKRKNKLRILPKKTNKRK